MPESFVVVTEVTYRQMSVREADSLAQAMEEEALSLTERPDVTQVWAIGAWTAGDLAKLGPHPALRARPDVRIAPVGRAVPRYDIDDLALGGGED